MKPIKPGDLKQRLIFQQPAGSTDDDGFVINKPVEYTKAWAKLKTLKGSTFYAAASNNMEHNREFTIRYQKKLADGVRPTNLEVVWKGITHSIESIENDDGLNISMTVVAKAVD
ncbi:phage head closure protein [Paucisalibacillus globulus]|uniref:phage head closure protein n=1 Tax=Paucisalibacillus globulus TaxID=351095 RepID=UPI000423F1D9|nr:phage head closure protein [Paucisalibacillus globulus]